MLSPSSPQFLLTLILMGIDLFILIPYSVICIKEMHRLKRLEFLAQRRMTIFMISSIIVLLGLALNLPILALDTLELLQIPSQILVGLWIFSWNTLGRLIISRMWLVNYTNKYQQFIVNREWRSILNPTETDWYFENRQTYGSTRYMLPRELASIWIFTALVFCLQFADDNLITVITLQSLWLIVFFILLLSLYLLISPLYDAFYIRQELAEIVYLTLGLALSSIILIVLYWADNGNHRSWMRIFAILIQMIAYFLFLYITSAKVLFRNLSDPRILHCLLSCMYRLEWANRRRQSQVDVINIEKENNGSGTSGRILNKIDSNSLVNKNDGSRLRVQTDESDDGRRGSNDLMVPSLSVSGGGNSSVSDVVLRWDDWIHEKDRFSAFMQSLTKEFAVENLLFYAEVAFFRSHNDPLAFPNPFDYLDAPTIMSSTDYALVQASHIYKKYCEASKATLEINLSHSVRDKLRKYFDESKDYLEVLLAENPNTVNLGSSEVVVNPVGSTDLLNVFDEALEEIDRCLTDAFSRFQSSKEYDELMRREVSTPFAERQVRKLFHKQGSAGIM